MPMFGNKHYSNPKVGERHEAMNEGTQEAPQEKAHSYHVFHHEDGTAHSHIHHASGEHEHTDHESPQEAHAHVAKAMGAEEATESPEFEAGEKEGAKEYGGKMSMHNAARFGGGAF